MTDLKDKKKPTEEEILDKLYSEMNKKIQGTGQYHIEIKLCFQMVLEEIARLRQVEASISDEIEGAIEG